MIRTTSVSDTLRVMASLDEPVKFQVEVPESKATALVPANPANKRLAEVSRVGDTGELVTQADQFDSRRLTRRGFAVPVPAATPSSVMR